MKPIDFIGLKNFRVFDDQNGIFEELSSINLLTGTNNSGKSSIIKYLQMLKDSVSGTKTPFDLDLNQQEHLLGDFENVLNNPGNRNIEVSLPFSFLGITTIYSTFLFNIPSQRESYKGHLRKITITDKKDSTDLFSFAYRKATDSEKELHLKEHKRMVQEHQEKKNAEAQQRPEDIFLSQIYFPQPYSPLLAYIDWSINMEKLKSYLVSLLEFYELYLERKRDTTFLENADKELEKQSFNASFLIKSLKSEVPVQSWKDFVDSDIFKDKSLKGKEPLVEYDFQSEEYYFPSPEIEQILYHRSIGILNEKLNWKNNNDPDNIYDVISECFKNSYQELTWRISTINYLSTIKGENSRIYIGTNNSAFTNLLKHYSSLNPDTSFINKYLKAFEIGDRIKVNFERKHQVISISVISEQSIARDLVDFGYGIKQLVLILMHIGVVAEKNKRSKEVFNYGDYDLEDYYTPSLLLIEEPETNLHPKWQSLLAEMFAEANTLYNIQLVIETHSEYLIRKFQNLTAEGKINSKDVKIFYLRGAQKTTKERKQLETIFIEPDGSIDYKLFDGGFFDEAHKLELSLLNFQRDNFFRDFDALKANNLENETKISDLQQKIDDFTSKTDMAVYQALVNAIFIDSSKLSRDSLHYLSTGQYLYYNIDDHSDFSPVVLQYGRAVENELYSLFSNINPAKRWTIGLMQGSLEKYKFGTTALTPCNTSEYLLLQRQLVAIFNTPADLKIELLEDLRAKRNESAHPGPPKTKAEALDYINKTNDFLKKWSELKK